MCGTLLASHGLARLASDFLAVYPAIPWAAMGAQLETAARQSPRVALARGRPLQEGAVRPEEVVQLVQASDRRLVVPSGRRVVVGRCISQANRRLALASAID